MPRAAPRPAQSAAWTGWRVDDCHGRRVGTLVSVYEDGDSGEPAWFLVRLTSFSTRYVLTPPADALAQSGRLWLPYERLRIEDGPAFFAPPVEITPAVEADLRRHFRLRPDAEPAPALRARRPAA
jgi:hypothetical protein